MYLHRIKLVHSFWQLTQSSSHFVSGESTDALQTSGLSTFSASKSYLHLLTVTTTLSMLSAKLTSQAWNVTPTSCWYEQEYNWLDSLICMTHSGVLSIGSVTEQYVNNVRHAASPYCCVTTYVLMCHSVTTSVTTGAIYCNDRAWDHRDLLMQCFVPTRTCWYNVTSP